MTQVATEGTIRFWVDGTPKAQPRPRAFYRKGIGARVYDAGTAEGWKGSVALAARPHVPAKPLSGPLYVAISFYIPRPKSHYRTGSHAGELRPDAPVYHAQKPDRDNLEKAVLDALTQIGMWEDDSQADDGPVQKFWANDRSGAAIEIRQL